MEAGGSEAALEASQEHKPHLSSVEMQKNVKQRPPMLSLPRSPSLSLPTQPTKARNRIQEESSSGSAYGVASRRGKRRINREDRCTTLPFVEGATGSAPLSIFGVFDGHGGQRAAHFASTRIPQTLLKRLILRKSTVQEALRLAFLRTDDEFNCGGPQTRLSFQQRPDMGVRSKSGSRFASIALQPVQSFGSSSDLKRVSSQKYDLPSDDSSVISAASSDQAVPPSSQQPLLVKRTSSRAEDQVSTAAAVPHANCGTTATVLVLHGDEMTVAHVGDSRAVLCTSGDAVPICEDHRPGRADEMRRIESAGGLILKVGGTYRVNGVLAVSRAIGDKELKEFVVAEPDVSTRRLKDEDEFLVIASDGLWDMMSDQECITETRKALQTGERCLEAAARGLVAVACERGSSDDISVVVIDLREYMGKLQEHSQPSNTGPDIIQEAVLEVSFSNLDLPKHDTSPGISAEDDSEQFEQDPYCMPTPRCSASARKSDW